ncbi:hypothetical protein Taro_041643, partial [Colocasia esculenta]|nr:hypothetical protein [Colocasia esculenta]
PTRPGNSLSPVSPQIFSAKLEIPSCGPASSLPRHLGRPQHDQHPPGEAATYCRTLADVATAAPLRGRTLADVAAAAAPLRGRSGDSIALCTALHLAELDGPFVKLRLKGRLNQEILEVDVELLLLPGL